MYHFFVAPDAIVDKTITIAGKDVNHIKNVLRLKPGEEISVNIEGSEAEYRCIIKEFTKDTVICDLAFIKEEGNELPSKIFLFQGLPKSDKFETIIQKSVELGVFEIVPVAMKRCVMKVDEKKVEGKVTRWQSIAEAAAKQSKRSVIPQVKAPMSFKEAVKYAKECDVKLLPYELSDEKDLTKDILSSIVPGQSIAIFIGPEGGFDETEVTLAIENGFKTITLGKRILRTETAGPTLLSYIMLDMEINH